MVNIHQQLQQDCVVLGSFPLSWLLLNKDCHYPWFILVPNRAEMTEIFQLDQGDQQQLMHESAYLAEILSRAFKADKMNIAALGNMVSQLHIHHIVRYRHDIAWPAPVWGYTQAAFYTAQQIEQLKEKMRAMCLDDFDYSSRPKST